MSRTRPQFLMRPQPQIGYLAIRMDTKEKNSHSEYGFLPRSDPCETRFVGTHQPVTGAKSPSRNENKMYIDTKTEHLSDCER